MNATLVSQPREIFGSSTSRSVGDDGRTLGRLMDEYYVNLLNSFSIGKPRKDALDALYEAFDECCKADWDGYSALPVSYETYKQAERFLQALPTTLPAPDISVEPDGEISFEWRVAPKHVFAVSVGPNEELSYAGLFGASNVHGTEQFYDEVPRVVLDNVKRLFS